MKLSYIVTAICLLVTSINAQAHDFWLEPAVYRSQNPSSIALQFKVGHKEDTSHWNLAWDRIVALRTYSSDGVTDMAASVVPKTSMLPGMAKTATLSPGSHIIGLESYHATSVLKAKKFNQYAEEEGLIDILSYREARGQNDIAGKELYSRKAKTIVQVGDVVTSNALKPIGHTLEIVPLEHPYTLTSDTLSVQVLFKGKPLSNALIDALSLVDHNAREQAITTDSEGKATFKFEVQGPVILTTVWGVPLSSSAEADFETYFASLTFEYFSNQ
tara:strand:+ start:217 stop:1035 length:819 start_codon:yes stop_codon:yes gene_type:complete